MLSWQIASGILIAAIVIGLYRAGSSFLGGTDPDFRGLGLLLVLLAILAAGLILFRFVELPTRPF